MRRVFLLCAGTVALFGLLAGCDAGAFAVRAFVLERAWQGWEAAGLPASSLAPARDRLAEVESRRSGPIPYSLISAALVRDPLVDPERLGVRAHDAAVAAAGRRAEAALASLEAIGGANYEAAYEDDVLALGRAREPADFDGLAASWRHQATVLQGQRDELARTSGGLSGGLPKDVVEGAVRLLNLSNGLDAAGLQSGSGWAVEAHVQMYLRQHYDGMERQHASIEKDLQAALSQVGARMDLLNGARQTLSQAEKLLPRLESLGAGQDFQGRLDQLRQKMSSAHDDPALTAAAQSGRQLVTDMRAAELGTLPVQDAAAPLPCIPGAPKDLIVIHLATQELDAYTDGCPWLRTPVTTGRPALPTDRGTFHIFAKYAAFHMVSQWPKSSPFYYPPTWVYNAMEFVGDGTFIHNANWEPPGAYGRGSEYGPYASHGCIHVMDGPLQQLYSWAPIGTTVEVVS